MVPEAMLSRSPGAQRQGRPVSPAADMAELLDGVVELVTFSPLGLPFLRAWGASKRGLRKDVRSNFLQTRTSARATSQNPQGQLSELVITAIKFRLIPDR